MSVNLFLVCDPCRKMVDLGSIRQGYPLGNHIKTEPEQTLIENFMINHLDNGGKHSQSVGLRVIVEHEAYVLMDTTPKYEEIEAVL